MNLAASLVTMMNIGNFNCGPHDIEPINWKNEESLADIIKPLFPAAEGSVDDSVKLEQAFHALNLELIGGLDIVWTWSLADHLMLSNDSRKLHIFHCLTWLHWQIEEYVALMWPA